MADSKEKTMSDWFDEISVRFIVNLPENDLTQPARLGFSIEEAHWFYEDFIRPASALESPKQQALPSLNLKRFITLLFAHCPLLAGWATQAEDFYENFIEYKGRVPVRGLILLDASMEKVLLVKGFKKGAKWSFPRGKIARDEDDLTCAVREVYEETGFDAREAGLVPEEYSDDVKSFEHSVRDQDLKLYVIRGVPLETHFAPRTRKEISKIDWWNLADLPTMKRTRQFEQQQHALQQDPQAGANIGAGPVIDPETKPSNFYMVAPFIGPLRHWIKQERRKDRARERAKYPRQIIIEDEETETAGEEIMPEAERTEAEEDDIQRLLARLQESKPVSVQSPRSTLPKVSTAPNQAPPPPGTAEALKGLLGVTSPSSSAPQPVEPRQETGKTHPLLAMLHGTSAQPHTPFEQIDTYPPIATTPHHQHPHPPESFSSFAPPPTFPLPPTHLHRQHHHPSQLQTQQNLPFSEGAFPSMAPLHSAAPLHVPAPMHIQERAPPQQQAEDGSARLQLPQPQNAHGPAIPEASRLPLPKLTSHGLALLNAFKSPTALPPNPLFAPAQSNIGRPLESHATPEKISPESNISSTGLDREPPPVPQYSKPKPTTQQQNTLLDLFRQKPSSVAKTVHQPRQTMPSVGRLGPPNEPAELSARPSSPHLHRQSNQRKPSLQRQTSGASSPHPPVQPSLVLDTQGLRPRSPGLTSATVSGPLNAPDFEAIKRNQKVSPVELGQGSGPSSAVERPQEKHWQPREILQRPASASRRHLKAYSQGSENEGDIVLLGTRTAAGVSPRSSPNRQRQQKRERRPESSGRSANQAEKDKPWQPQPGQISILKRPSPSAQVQATSLETQPPHTSPPPTILAQDVQSSSPTAMNTQKSLLLSLFASPQAAPPQPRLTPTADLGNLMSPVSPLPAASDQSRVGSLVSALAESRQPSINEGTARKGNLTEASDTEQTSPMTPTDRSFLLQYLQGVVANGCSANTSTGIRGSSK